ncbi:MAG: hypothetical protein M3292_03530 [Actinomycetota bacterium]|nr:hypothetical protein [Actinomycetota bacterium]
MKRFATRLFVVAVLAGFFVPAFGTPPASAAKPCWQRLIDDWYDGRIDRVYSPKCYREAIRNSPEDIRSYSDLQEDLRRVLQSSGQTPRRGRRGETYIKPGSPGRDASRRAGPSSKAPAAKAGGGDKRATDEGGGETTAGGAIGSDEPKGPVPQVIRDLGPDDSSSVPIPLIALGSLALLLIASGVIGVVVKRLHARRAAAGPTAADPPAPDA